ncbi:unnamed protein product, partial [marine sediment metagenome]
MMGGIFFDILGSQIFPCFKGKNTFVFSSVILEDSSHALPETDSPDIYQKESYSN